MAEPKVYYRVTSGLFGQKGAHLKPGDDVHGVFVTPHKEAAAQLAKDIIERHYRISGEYPEEPIVSIISPESARTPKLADKENHYSPYDADELYWR
jgi:hypothetical protein